MENLLSLDIQHNPNPKVLTIIDTSLCINSVENYLLEVLPPQKNKWLTYPVVPNFTFIANASNLKLARVNNPSDLPDLPDGIYEFKISYKPNFATQLQYYHLRISSLKQEYDKVVTDFYNEKCDVTKKEFSEKRNRLLEIYMDMMAAIAMIEKAHDKNKGLELYNKVKEDLKYFKDDCRC